MFFTRHKTLKRYITAFAVFHADRYYEGSPCPLPCSGLARREKSPSSLSVPIFLDFFSEKAYNAAKLLTPKPRVEAEDASTYMSYARCAGAVAVSSGHGFFLYFP